MVTIPLVVAGLACGVWFTARLRVLPVAAPPLDGRLTVIVPARDEERTLPVPPVIGRRSWGFGKIGAT